MDTIPGSRPKTKPHMDFVPPSDDEELLAYENSRAGLISLSQATNSTFTWPYKQDDPSQIDHTNTVQDAREHPRRVRAPTPANEEQNDDTIPVAETEEDAATELIPFSELAEAQDDLIVGIGSCPILFDDQATLPLEKAQTLASQGEKEAVPDHHSPSAMSSLANHADASALPTSAHPPATGKEVALAASPRSLPFHPVASNGEREYLQHQLSIDPVQDEARGGPAQASPSPSSHGNAAPSPRRPVSQEVQLVASTSAKPASDEALARAAAMLPPSPPRRNLRARKAQQLNPYTLEALRYQRTLISNDWQDAVVSQREWARQERQRIREEQEALASGEHGSQSTTQSQWLVPDPEDEAQEAIWRREEDKARLRKEKEAKRLGRDRERQGSSSTSPEKARKSKDAAAPQARKAPREPLFPELADGLDGSSSSGVEWPSVGSLVARPSKSRPSRPSSTTYGKRGRGTGRDPAQADESSAMSPRTTGGGREPTGSGSASSSPVLPPSKQRRLHTASDQSGADSDSDIEMIAVNQRTPAPSRPRPFSLGIDSDSSADEAPVVRQGSSVKRRQQARKVAGGDAGSSSDSTDYERRFRQLKKMMPAGMARKHIEDLRAMRHGKAYHSDGHISSTPTASEQSYDEEGITVVADRSTPSTSPLDAGELQPGEARKRLRRRSVTDGDLSLLFEGDPESETSSCFSGSVAELSDSDVDTENSAWWAHRAPERNSREADAIDRMLSRTNGAARPRPRAKRPAKAGPRWRQRLDSHLAPRAPGMMSDGPLREVSANHADSPLHHRSGGGPKHKRKKKVDPRVGKTKSKWQSPAGRGINPPVVRPRTRPRLDFINDDILFDFEMIAGVDGGNLDGDAEIASMLGDGPAPAEPDQGPNAKPLRRTVSAASSASSSESRRYAQDVATPMRRGPQDMVTSPTKQPHTALNRQLYQPMRPQSPPAAAPAGFASPARNAGAVSPAGAAKDVDAQRTEAEMWDDHDGLRVDFGIQPLPAGIRFADSTYLGRGRLYELTQLCDASLDPEQMLPSGWEWTTVHVGQVELQAWMSLNDVVEILPALFEALARSLQPQTIEDDLSGSDAAQARAPQPPNRSAIDEAARFLCLKLTAEALCPETDLSFLRLYRAIINKVDLFLQHLRNTTSDLLPTTMALRWFRVEMCWRLLAICGQDMSSVYGHNAVTFEELAACSKSLMVLLLRNGLHKTMRQVRMAAQPRGAESNESGQVEDQPPPAATNLTDQSAELWVCLIHALDRAGRLEGGAELISFWTVFEGALQKWQAVMSKRSQLIASESIWYCILSVCSLSHFSASTGMSLSTPHLREHWPIVTAALSQIRLRYDDTVENTMSFPALSKRDQYIRVLLQRCFDLALVWNWKLEGAEVLLSKIFEMFNSHKLADLPSESDHDFPQFLRDFDDEVLHQGASREDSCFHIFVKVLARAGRDLLSSAKDAIDGDRKVSRLFSRITPVRVMPFTRSDVPTSGQRSMLFNHYTVVMLYLHLVPGQATQRLRQIKSFLRFKEADFASQVACVRAMMYAAVIFRHHQLDVTPISAWFGEVTETLMIEYDSLEKTTGTQNQRLAPVFETGHARQIALRRQGEVARLIVAVLRSLQHVIQHPSLSRKDSGKLIYPDLNLLHKSWTKDILEAQLAIEPAIGHEALKCLQTFLLQRNKAVEVQPAPANANDESQDSFGDLFDDNAFDFEDPALDDLLGGESASDQPSLKGKERAFSEYAMSVISPALFRLVSNIYHPDRRLCVSLGVTERLAQPQDGTSYRSRMNGILKDAERRLYLEMVIDCWAGCAHVMISNGQRDWTSYLTFGNESWKRIDDPVGKRDVGLRFLQNIAVLDPQSFETHEAEFFSVWFQCAIARVLSIQHLYTCSLLSLRPEHALTRGWTPPSTLEAFSSSRKQLLVTAFENMAGMTARPMLFACLSGLLSAMRGYVDEMPRQARGSKAYLTFCSDVLRALREKVDEKLLRGVGNELALTMAHLEKKR